MTNSTTRVHLDATRAELHRRYLATSDSDERERLWWAIRANDMTVDALAGSDPSLDAAWSDAEAALPERWRLAISPYYPRGWEAYAYDIEQTPTSARTDHSSGACFGESPVDALRALTETLRDSALPL